MDKITKLNRQLKKIQQQFTALKKSGLNEELLILYMHDKTKLSKKKVKQMLYSQEQFFKDLISKTVSEEL